MTDTGTGSGETLKATNSDLGIWAQGSIPASSYDVEQTIPFTITLSSSSGVAGYLYINGTEITKVTGTTSTTYYYTPSSVGTFTWYMGVQSTTFSATPVDSSKATVTVASDPSVSITVSTGSIDLGQQVTLSSTVSGGLSAYKYSWSESGVSGSFSSTSASNPTWTSSGTGTASFLLSLTDASGYTVTASASVTVDSDPNISISSSLNPSDVGQSVDFSTSVSGGTGSYSSYNYILYDGTSTSDSQLASGSSSSFSYTFSSSGSYLLDYSVTDTNGYTQSTSLTQTVNTDPSVSVSSSQNPTDVGKSVTFTASASGGSGSYSYQWYANSNAVSGATSSTYSPGSYSSSGSYSYYVKVTDGAGYSVDSNTITETVNSDPTVSASSNVSSADVGYPIEFSATPSGGTSPYSYSWTIGGTEVSTFQDFSYSFSSAGSYSVEVTVTDRIGETYSASVTVTINNNPSVSISSNQNPTDAGNSVTFTASESGGTGTVSYAWFINGASEGSGSTLDYSFSSAGSYTVEVVVTDSDGHAASYTITETVYSDPSVTISSSQNPTDAGNSVTFTASPTGGSGSYTYQWYLNGAAVSGATSSTYTTSFSSFGTEEIYVIIKDSIGNSAQSSTLDETVNADPSVSITSSQNPTDVGNSVTFTASGSGGSGSYTYQWYVNSAAVSGATSSTYTTSFSSSGTEDVYVVLTDGVGNTATSSTLDEKVNNDPSVSISSSQNPTDVGNSITFTADGTGGTGAFSYVWYLNGATQSSTTSTFSTSFSSAGTYYINVTVQDSVGNTASYSFAETVYVDPAVTISSSQNPTDVGNDVTFTALPSGGDGTYSYQWYLNGVAVSGATSSTYTTIFSSAGSDSVYVIITDGVGNTARSSMLTETVNTDPSVSVSSSQNPTDVGNDVTFTSSITGGSSPYTYAWYNDGTLESSISSTYTTSFSASGTYTIEVIITDTNGNKAYANFTETVNADPSVSVSSGQNPTDIGNSVTFKATGSDGTPSYTYQWYYGSNSTAISGATGYEYTRSFSSTGTYEFYVILTDANGNTARAYINETVNPDPSVTVNETPSPTDTGVPVTFDSTPSGGTGSYNYTWTINGVNYYIQDPTVTFNSQGTYSATVTIRDSNGNTATATESIVVNRQPEVSISVQYNPVYAGTNDLLRATGSFGTGSYNYTWTNNSIVIGYGAYFTYKFGAQGTYTIEVKITDGLGQTNTSATDITVKPQPDVSIAGPTNITYGATNYWSLVVNGSITGGEVYWYISGINQTGDANEIQISLSYHNTTATSLQIAADYIVQSTWYNVSITVKANNPPTAKISVAYSTIDSGVTDLFTSVISGGSPGFTYSWTINGATFSSEDVSYAFSSAGTYLIKLTATDGDGVSASAETNVTVLSDPSVTITTQHSQYDKGYSATFTAAASNGNGSYTYQWYIDGTAFSGATSSDFSHSFSSVGSYTVYVVVSDSFGVQATSNQITVEIVNQPFVTVSASSITADAGQPITFSSAIFNGTGPFTYEWLVSTGEASNQSSFTHSFSSAGTYTVEISVTDADGYSSVAKVNVTISSDPSITASALYSQLDTGATETFSASLSGGSGPYAYTWVLDGNIISNSASFTHIFNSAGTRTVEVSVTDSNGFTSYANVTVDVVSLPSASFTEKYTGLDVNIEDLFNSSVQYGTAPFNYTWYVDSGIVGYGSTLSYTFTSEQVAYVNLTVRDADGYTSTVSHRIYVYAAPAVSVLANRTAIDQGMSVGFLASGYNGTGPYNYTWEVDGTVTGYGSSLDYSFTSSGTYTVTAIVKDSFGETGSRSLSILVNKPLTVIASAALSSIDSGQSDTFTGTVNGGNGPYYYSWFIGGSVVGSSQNLTYLFDTAGTYTLTFKVTDSLDVSESYSLSITVNPTLAGTMKVTYTTVDENITDSIALTAANGTAPYTYSIFINGTLASSSSSYSRYFTTPGTYDVVAYVNDSRGESIVLRSTITVRANPSVYIVAPTNNTDANVPIQFRGILSGGTGPYNYSWLIGGHTYTNSTLTHSFASAGGYDVQLTAIDTFGREAIANVNETVHPDPSATLVVPSYIRASQENALFMNITGGIAPYAVQWYFPSGEQFSGRNITHAFTNAGPETFQAKITDSTGYVDTQNFTVDVHLYVAIAANQTSGLGPMAVQFSSSVLGGSDYSYNWTFGNGHYSLEQNPVYEFSVGNYTVHFSVTSANGANGYANLSIQSLPPPVAFEYSTGLNITQNFHFQAIPNWDAAGPYNMSWSFPNGQTITGMNISYRFPVYNELNTVIATFSYGSGKTWTQYLTVRMIPAVPAVTFTPPSIIPEGTMLSLNATASAPDSNSFTYAWDINGTSESGQSVLYYFQNPGNYPISVTVTDGLGASATVHRIIEVLPQGSNSSIAISYTRSVNGPMDYYTIKVLSTNGIIAVEAFLGTTPLNISEINSTYTASGELAYFNLTMDQRDYPAGTYGISVVAFNNASQSNHITVSFTVTSQYSSSTFSLADIISFFGGFSNFLITVLTLGGLVIAYASLRRQDNPDLIVEGMNPRGKSERIVLKGKK